MDLTTVYCDLDDFYCNFSLETPTRRRLPTLPKPAPTALVMFRQRQGLLYRIGPRALRARVSQ